MTTGHGYAERGMTLVELVVAMFLVSILGVMITTSIRAVTRTSMGVTERVSSQGNARVALGALTRDLRLAATPPNSSAPPIRVAEADRVELTANVAGVDLPSLIEIVHVDDALRETIVAPAVVGDAVVYLDAPRQRFVARDVRDVATAGHPIFTYHDANGNDLADADGVVPWERLGLITTVEISVTVKANDHTPTAPTVLSSTVRLLNELHG